MPWQRHKWSPICDRPKGLVRPVPLDEAGRDGPTRGQARGRNWRQTSRGLYVPSWVDAGVPEQRILETAMLLPPGGAVTGWAACRLHGGNFFDGRLPDGVTEIPVPLSIGLALHRKPHRGVTFHRDRLDDDEIEVLWGIPTTCAERAVFDAMRFQGDVREAVVDIDMASAAQITSISRLDAYADLRERWNGIPLARTALDLADEHSRSPNETRLRLIWRLDAGLPAPLVNQPVWSRQTGKLIGIADLLHLEAGMVGEFDGADHRGAVRHSDDVDREGRFRHHGLEFFRVTGLNLQDRRRVVHRIMSTLSRAHWLPEDQRSWTIVPPLRETPGPTLDEVLDERDFQRELHERWLRESGADPRGVIGG